MKRLPAALFALYVLFSCSSGRSFDLSGAVIVTDPQDARVVSLSASLLREDIKAVTGGETPSEGGKRLIIGTVGHSAPVDSLISAHRLDVSGILGGWEQYVVEAVDRNTLVVAGCDRRGTAYGVFALSEQIGVNPFYWWADVPVEKTGNAVVDGRRFVSARPSVKYRGIFINDEDWCLKPWASNNFEKELGDIGPRTYGKVCELILRLGGNMLAPAMHSCTGAFYSYPENKEVADDWGILITTSHCEPMLFNNAAKSEWDSEVDGQWNYRTNKETIYNKFDRRLAEAGMYENIYTIGMRGIHDYRLEGDYPIAERAAILEEVIADQREILQRHTGKEPETVPQIFVPYKETMDIYEYGVKIPEDVTLVWPDDNYGYLKRVSNAAERKRSGASGVYYHAAYLGSPHDNTWISTTAPVLMYEELKKAWDNGATRYWLLNVGDIKPTELAMKTFFDLAMNIDAYDIRSINRHQSDFLASIYGQEYRSEFQHLLDEYYRLAWSRKPEFMGWERQQTYIDHPVRSDTDFSFCNYSEAQWRLSDYRDLSDKADSLLRCLPEEYRPSFFEFIGYPAKGACQMNRKFLLAQLNHEKFAAGEFAQAEWAGLEAKAAYDSIEALNAIYNTMLGGKWAGMMQLAVRYNTAFYEMPDLNMSGAVPEAADLAPKPVRYEGCLAVDISLAPTRIDGIGYDWVAAEITDLAFDLPSIPSDSVSVHIWTVPFWPLYEGVGNRYSVAVDGAEPVVLSNNCVEFSDSWKDQVLQNGHKEVVSFCIDRNAKSHGLRLKAVDPGQMVQKIIVDWGGFRPCYVPPYSPFM